MRLASTPSTPVRSPTPGDSNPARLRTAGTWISTGSRQRWRRLTLRRSPPTAPKQTKLRARTSPETSRAKHDPEDVARRWPDSLSAKIAAAWFAGSAGDDVTAEAHASKALAEYPRLDHLTLALLR